MNKEEVLNLIELGEGINIEFKESKNALNKSTYQTICAFLNRIGGHILLGVNDKGKIEGVKQEIVAKIKKEIVTTINNSQKINPPVYLSVDDVEIDGKTVIVIYIPESSQVHRCNGRIYDRNEDGDLDITQQADNVAMLYMRKQSTFSENKVYSYLTINEFRKDLFEKVRKIIRARSPGHPWLSMSNEDLLKSAGFYQKDYAGGKNGFTLGAALLFGRDDVILSILSYHKTDAILRRENRDRYDDREIVETNLIDSFDILMGFIAKHLPDPFFLEGDVRISLREKIFREVISNILIHREYLNPYPAKLIIEETKVITENANKAHGFGHINPAKFSPFPKNPKIARFFREIGRADELGSGVRNIFKYTPLYSKGATPEIIEEDIFKIIVPLVPQEDKTAFKKTIRETGAEKYPEKYPEKADDSFNKTELRIMEIMESNPKVTRAMLAQKIGLTDSAIKKNIRILKEKGVIRRVGADRGGHWEIVRE